MTQLLLTRESSVLDEGLGSFISRDPPLSPEVIARETPGPVPRASGLPRNLPTPPTALIDRQQETALAGRLLAEEGAELVTLLGAGGVGKTRLAIAVAEAFADRWPHGACFVDLAPLTDPSQIAPTIARALGLRHSAAESVEHLRRHLQRRTLLLVLDNCEQLLPALGAIAEALLESCPGLAVLATSREPLRLRRERRLPIAPLGLPDLRRPIGPSEAAASPAVALFVERARAVDPTFELTAANAQTVATLCARLDGLPLAIELAAARGAVLSPEALLERLDQRLSLLVDGALDLPERHRSLRDAVAWSYDLLSSEEQRLFRSLAVFRGGSTVETTAAVCPPTTDSEPGHGSAARLLHELNTLERLASLADKTLLTVAHPAGEEPRFGMLETVREYALEQLEASGEVAEARRRHAANFTTLAASELTVADRAARLRRLEREHDNLSAALRWARETGGVEATRRLEAALAETQATTIGGSSTAPSPTSAGTSRDPANPLSEREQAVLRLVAEGLPSKQIGAELAIAERTVKAHLTGAMNKLGAFTRAQAVAVSLQRCLL
jgi:predicted ATPase/DNA-binding CsgD family transcriptional regulator